MNVKNRIPWVYTVRPVVWRWIRVKRGGKERVMRAAHSKRIWSGRKCRVAPAGVCAAVTAGFLVVQTWAVPKDAGTTGKTETASEVRAARIEPNYALEERFLPDQVSKLVFDLAVTPHWFSESDRFWYSYQTTAGTRYYIVDPMKKSKTPLWDNAKVAAANTLIKANKRFEMLVFPGMRHSYMPINSYVIVARGDFFSKWLLGSSETGADVIELQNAKQATASKKLKE
jgi:hypothetical protein